MSQPHAQSSGAGRWVRFDMLDDVAHGSAAALRLPSLKPKRRQPFSVLIDLGGPIIRAAFVVGSL
jgi:hypothetical protein